ncbi:hypothetical protein ACFQ5J_13660 [Lacticaseibacillus baoqingensis]|uniref:Lipoprotein n=1 Tax=Lacticaseibacillus baoqingensis TaxID=2486013 RepID=A0ABW4EAM1_9LACO|nr:hypothetical protein [Lacticaseibacillus baoqingensis]
MKKIVLLALSLAAVVSLSACGQQLTTTKKTYHPDEMVAVIKGTAKGHSQVRYQAATAKGTAKVNSGSFVLSIPPKTTAQTVTIKAGSQQTKVTVASAKAIGTYQTVAKSFNQAVIATALPPAIQKQMQTATTPDPSAIAKMTPAQKAAMAQQQQAMQQALVKAQQATKAQQLPLTASGLKQVLNTDGGQVRANVQDGQLISITDVVSTKAMKDKKSSAAFATQFGLLAHAVGADAKTVGKALTKTIKNAASGETNTDTITSHGVKFNLGLSADHLYLYITK